METPEEFLKNYHNNLPSDWLFEKREVVARLIKEHTDQALRIHEVRLSLLDKVKEIAFGDGSAQERMVDIKALFSNEA